MRDGPVLHGYRYSVYTRVARLALHHKGVACRTVEVDPFTDPDPAHLDLHPFGRVPVLVHGGATLYETRAITAYVDAAFDGPALQPVQALALARVEQVLSIVDAYGYWPLVRQVFAHRVFRPLEGEVPDKAEIVAGLGAARVVLAALESIAVEALVLSGDTITRADCHLAPMMDYFTRAPEGSAMLADFPMLSRWWRQIGTWPALRATDPGLGAGPL